MAVVRCVIWNCSPDSARNIWSSASRKSREHLTAFRVRWCHMLGAGLVGIETRLRVGRFGVRTSLEERDFISYRNFRTALGPTLPPTQLVSWLFRRGTRRSLKSTNYLYLVPRMNGVRQPVPLYAFMGWTGKPLKLHLHLYSQIHRL
jgi:hypothetical protein